MRLDRPCRGLGRIARLRLWLLGKMVGEAPPGFACVLLYRRRLFAGPYTAYVQAALRGASPWSAGERELLAAVISRLNGCPFCISTHQAIAGHMLGAELVQRVLDGDADAGLRPALAHAVAFVRALAADPGSVDARHVRALREAGVERDSIETLVHVTAALTTINRVASALDLEVPSTRGMRRMLQPLIHLGYRV